MKSLRNLVSGLVLMLASVTAFGQAVPADDTTVHLTTSKIGGDDTHLAVNWNQSSTGVNQSNEAYIRFDTSMFPSTLTGAGIQKATLILYVEEGGTSGHVTICQLSAPWSSTTMTGQNPAPCKTGIAPISFAVTASQIAEGSFITVDVTPVIQNWFNGQPNYGIGLMAEAPITGTGNGINVKFDSIKDNGNGYPAQLQLVLQSQGPIGPQGPAGVAGSAGVAGQNGAQGPQGLPGANGAQGPIGLTGPAGLQGIAGVAGVAGLNGSNGSNGVDGAQGPKGDAGVAGVQGPKGDIGTTGAQGIAGPQGSIGLTGAVGPVGPAGPQGLTGAAGSNGTNGNDGAVGPQGVAGIKGDTGAQGPIGATGATGAVGAQGSIGLTGAVGPTGPAGAQGIQGFDGVAGVAGPSGPTGPQGPTGSSGFGGIWSQSGTYAQGQGVIRPAVGGSTGIFFNLTGNNAGDPAGDSTNWIYCCGTPSLGYAAFAITGALPTGLPPDLDPPLENYTFNAADSMTLSSLVITNLAGSVTGPSTQTQCTAYMVTQVGPVTGYFSGSTGQPLPACISFSGITNPPSQCSLIYNYGGSSNSVGLFSCAQATALPMGNITFTVLKNGLPTTMVMSGASGTLISPPGQVTFNAGDTLSLMVNNPQSVSVTNLTGTWSIH